MDFPIKIAAQRSGLTPQRIRMWEKRYGPLSADRTSGHRRRFSAEDIERLRLLHDAVERGHRVGDLVTLPAADLRQLAGRVAGAAPEGAAGVGIAATLVERALGAVEALDDRGLIDLLDRGAISLGHQGLLQQVIAPLVQSIGRQWCEGRMLAVHEHFTTALLRTYLLGRIHAFAPAPQSPVVVCVTPSGQLHELGAVLVAAVAANQGWRVLYLGASLPATEIVAAVNRTDARLVALSIVHPADDPRLADELRLLRRLLPARTALLAGGGAVPGYQDVLLEVAAHASNSLDDVVQVLQRLRARA